MDLNALAASALLNKLAKAKLLPKGQAAEPFKTDEALKEKAGVEEWPLLRGVWEDETLGLAWTSTRVSQSAPAEDAAAKARAKLLSNKVLAEETAKAVEALGKLVEKPQGQTSATDGAEAEKEPAKPNGEPSSAPTKTKAAKTKEEPDREWSGSEDEGEEEGEEAAELSDGEEDHESNEEDEGLDEEAIQERVAQLGDLDQWDHLIGGSGSDEGEDDEEEEGSSDEDDAAPRAVAASRASDAKKRKRSASPEAQRKGKKKVAVAAPAPANASSPDSSHSDEDDNDSASDAESSASSASSSSSRYLPTLSHGFVTQSLRTRDDDFSGSEDAGDFDFEEDVEDHLPKGKGTKASNGAAKKNRMGQRARKALWEKKYGRNANHVKLREKEKSKGDKPAYKPLRRGRDGKVLEEFVEPERKDSGWKRFPVKEDAAPAKAMSSSRAPLPAQGSGRGAASARPPRPQQQPRPPPSSHRPRGPAPSSAASDAAAMHPSWVAKQKQKEKEEAIARSLAGGGGGAGKKVVFD